MMVVLMLGIKCNYAIAVLIFLTISKTFKSEKFN